MHMFVGGESIYKDIRDKRKYIRENDTLLCNFIMNYNPMFYGVFRFSSYCLWFV